MKTLALDDELYAALQKQAETTGHTVDELAAEAIGLWLAVSDLNDEELAEIERRAARVAEEESGGIEAEEFFRNVRRRTRLAITARLLPFHPPSKRPHTIDGLCCTGHNGLYELGDNHRSRLRFGVGRIACRGETVRKTVCIR